MDRRFPEWIRRPWSSEQSAGSTGHVIEDLGIRTVCQSAKCPNIGECWARRTATFLILGPACTRHCRFCAVPQDKPAPVDPNEPARIAEAARRLDIRHAVITSVTRDDLPDGGACQFRTVIETLRGMNPAITIEVLIPDFAGDANALNLVMNARPNVLAHNIETVARCYPAIGRTPEAYTRSMNVLKQASAMAIPEITIKSGLMLGLGETHVEILAALHELLDAGCTAVTLGQYLQPTPAQHPVVQFITPETFAEYEAAARAMGFRHAVAGPFVRSSYHADEMITPTLKGCTAAQS